jgi:hypothetical protein
VYVTGPVRDALYREGALLTMRDLVARFSNWRGTVGPPSREQLRRAALLGRLRGVVVAPAKRLYFYAALIDDIAADFRSWWLKDRWSADDEF